MGRRGDSRGANRRLVTTLATHMAAPMKSHASGTTSAAAEAPYAAAISHTKRKASIPMPPNHAPAGTEHRAKVM